MDKIEIYSQAASIQIDLAYYHMALGAEAFVWGQGSVSDFFYKTADDNFALAYFYINLIERHEMERDLGDAVDLEEDMDFEIETDLGVEDAYFF